MCILNIKKLNVKIKKKKVINNLNLKIKKKEIHILMGPNGSGKSSLSLVIAGNKKYKIIKGIILYNNIKINKISTEERAKKGIFISFQNSIEIHGLNNEFFLQQSLNSIRKYNKKKKLNIIEIRKKIYKIIKKLNFNKKFLHRSLNEGFSGGEKKKNDILQILLLKPNMIILDEIDSGLDIKNLKLIIKIINKLKKKNKSFLIITHNPKIINNIDVDFIHIMNKGKIIKSSNKNISKIIEKKGYEKFIKKKYKN